MVEGDEKDEINAIVGRAVSELLISHNRVNRELLIRYFFEQSQKTNDKVMKSRLDIIIFRLLNSLH